jgi:hypothetical protein
MRRCNKHLSEQRGFCALEPGHKDVCSVAPRASEQGVVVPIKRKLIKAVPAHYIKISHPENALVRCLGFSVGDSNGCGALLPINTLEYIQTHWYVEHDVLGDGDYWNTDEGQFICPKCGMKNRLYERPEVVVLSGQFKSIKKVY